MTAQTKSALLLRANQIRTEMAGGANTAQRVGSLFVDMLDSTQGSQSIALAGATITLPPGVSFLQVDTSGAPAENLDLLLAPDARVADVLVIGSVSAARVPTIRHDIGNLWLVGAAPFTLTLPNYRIGFMWAGSRWQELWRNTA